MCYITSVLRFGSRSRRFTKNVHYHNCVYLCRSDFAGSGVVHLVGASSGLVATVMLKPRTGRYAPGQQWPALVNPVNAIMGTFMLW